jgi:hypothetical protein
MTIQFEGQRVAIALEEGRLVLRPETRPITEDEAELVLAMAASMYGALEPLRGPIMDLLDVVSAACDEDVLFQIIAP